MEKSSSEQTRSAQNSSSRASGAAASRRKTRKSRRLSPLRKLLTIVLLAVVIVAGMSLFFKVSVIQTAGNQKYSNFAIAEATGIEEGANLMTLRKSKIASLIMEQLPYITAVKITRQLPDTVVITVSEGEAAAVVADTTGAYWHISIDGKILEPVASVEDELTVVITGVLADEPLLGAQLKLADDEMGKLDQVLTLLGVLSENGILFDVSQIDMSKSFNPVLYYLDRFKVELGVMEELDYKIKYLLAVVDKLTDKQTGTIDLTFESEKVAHFRPD